MEDNKVELLKLTPNDTGGENCLTVFVKRKPAELPPINHQSNTDDTSKAAEVLKPTSNGNAWTEEDQLTQLPQNLKNSFANLNDFNLTASDRKLSRSWKVHIWRTLFHFFANSSFHGLPHIASSKRSYFRMTYWMVLLIVAFSIMLWAIISVTLQYNEKRTSLASKQEFNSRLPFPAVTVCNLNKYRLSSFQNFNISLEDVVNLMNFWSGYPFLLPPDFDIDTVIARNNHLFTENSPFQYSVSGHQVEDMLFTSRFAGVNYDVVNFTHRVSTAGNCYTFNSGETGSILYSGSTNYEMGFSIILNAEQYEYFSAESDSVGFNVFIHDQNHFPYFISSGSFTVSPGQRTQVAIKKYDYKLLSHANGGQCSDHVKLKIFKTYGLLSCVAECLTNIAVNECGCKHESMPGPAEVCAISNLCIYDVIEEFDKNEDCDCPVPCRYTQYDTHLSFSKFPAAHYVQLLNRSALLEGAPNPEFIVSSVTDENGEKQLYLNDNFTTAFLTDNIVKIVVQYDTLTSTYIEEGLEYSTFQFIADFGGHIGLFTGAGFLTLFELLELCLGTIRPLED